MSIYDSLNKEQQEACFHTDGPVLILAGAGSGKTRVITHRICYLIDEIGVNPYNILAITFTNKAAGEMRERVDKLAGFGAESIWISTFHAMCVRILRRFIDHIGYDTSFTIYDTDDSKTLMRGLIKQHGIDPKTLKEKDVLKAISSAKDELITPQRFREEHTQTYVEKLTGDLYDEYQTQLRKNNALDFDDLLMKTVELFRADEEVLKYWQNRFRYIMVDEYQDTNNAQFELIRQLAAASRNLCVVGDDDQSIYKFRGANIRNILDFEKIYPDAFVVKLEQNYRSTQNVLDAANAVIRNNAGRKQKSLWTKRGEGHKVHFRAFDTATDEAAFIAEDIGDCMRRDHGLKYGDFAVLYRTNAQARVLEECFVGNSMPYDIVGGTNFYARKEIKDLLCYLKTIANASDDLAVERIINVPRRGIGETSIERMKDLARSEGTGLFAALELETERKTLGRATAKIADFVSLIHSFREAPAQNSKINGEGSGGISGAVSSGNDSEDADYGATAGPLELLIKRVIDGTGYVEELKNSDDEDADDRISNIDELVSKVVSYEEGFESEHPGEVPTLSGFLEDVALVADIDEVDGDSDRVLLMTLHSAKGLEFSHVYMAGMEDGVFPGMMTIANGGEEEMEEERRLAYVGITRARDELTLTCARARMLRGETQYNPVSRFIREIPGDLLDGKVPAAKPLFGDGDDEDREDDGPFAGYRGGNGYGSRGYGQHGGRYSDDFESVRGGRTFVTYAGQPGGSGARGGSADDRSLPGSESRPKAVLGKTRTSADAHKPFIATASSNYQKLTKGSQVEQSEIDYGVGDRVSHVRFGSGTVSRIEKTPRDYKVTVEFDECGQKVMYAAFAKLQKEK
ncbi:MAG: UvrD-helicase domain-containing protein [Lachnospiraceae bacterium]|jgi:DNA helicase-2/ATP-dependent DNA helicase PcrA|nr:UvrD-helicase domain-containing protein [Lachnospiraceae bacterium]